ncbi:MAG: hypothetical protein GY803_00440 [Chloroflexi bacterium]|nr:hypothetical protein [Chloroflexota bacterium]
MTTLELGLQTAVFGLALWLGLYLISRNPTDGRLLPAGLGLVVYAVGLAFDLLAVYSPVPGLTARLTAWRRPFLYLPALFWLILFIQLSRSEIPWRDRLRRQPRSVSLLIVAAIFFVLGLSFIFFPLDWLPRLWVILGIGGDLLALGTAVAFFDAFDEGETLLPHFIRAFGYALLTALIFGGQVALVMIFSGGVTFPLLLLLLTTIVAAISMQTFAAAAQSLADRLSLTPFPQIRQQRAANRAAAEAAQRVDATFTLTGVDDAEFARLTRRALSYMGNLPRLAASPLTQLPLITERLGQRGLPPDTLTRAAELKAALSESIARLKPQNQGDFGATDAWRHYNALYFPYVVGIKPYSRRANYDGLNTAVQQALNWFRADIPQRTLYNWQNAAAKLVAQDLQEQSRQL